VRGDEVSPELMAATEGTAFDVRVVRLQSQNPKSRMFAIGQNLCHGSKTLTTVKICDTGQKL
jgi:hypothetical protein